MSKVSIFCAAAHFSSSALTFLGLEFTRASQVATAVLFHSSMTTSRSWWMLETLRSSTLRLRMPHRCSIGLRSGDMLGQSSPLPSASLARQWLSCWNTALRPSLRMEGIMLRFSMSQYMLAFMVPSMNCSSPVPAANWSSLRGVLTFVASSLDFNGCVLSYFEGKANLHCYTSCKLTTLHCSKVSFFYYLLFIFTLSPIFYYVFYMYISLIITIMFLEQQISILLWFLKIMWHWRLE